MMIGKSILFAVVLVVLHVSAGVTCTYEAVAPEECPNFGCVLDEDIDPDEYFIDGLHYDYDCNNIGECPMVPTEADEGLVCEADAQAYMAGGVTEYDVEPDLSIRPEGTDPDLDNCKLKDVYRVVCVAEIASCCDTWNAECYTTASLANNNHACVSSTFEGTPECGADCDGGAGSPMCEECCVKIGEGEDWNCPVPVKASCCTTWNAECYTTASAANNNHACVSSTVNGNPQCNFECAGGADSPMCEGCCVDYNHWEGEDWNCDLTTTTTELETTSTTTTTTELETTSTTTTTTELETTTSAPTELCETYVTAASCPASYCVIKNDRHGAFKKCKRVQCKTFSADEAACEASAECQPKYKFGAFINKCLLKKNLD